MTLFIKLDTNKWVNTGQSLSISSGLIICRICLGSVKLVTFLSLFIFVFKFLTFLYIFVYLFERSSLFRWGKK